MMKDSPVKGVGEQTAASLPRRDWFLLPLVSTATVLLVLFTLETIARRAFPDLPESPLDCLVLNDSSTGIHALPNTVCHHKLLEGPTVEYRYNRCGDRAGMECDPAPPGVLRVVLIGSSTTFGYGVPREQSFAALLPALLSERTGRAVQVYNAGIEFYGTAVAFDLQFQRVLALKPDIILWTMATSDFSNVGIITFVRGNAPPSGLLSTIAAASATLHNRGLGAAMGVAIAYPVRMVIYSRTLFMVRHLVYMDESQYERNAKMNREEVEFLRSHPDPESLQKLGQFAHYAAEIQAKANAARVPFVVSMLPLRLQASMISLHEGAPELDPYQPARFTRSVVESNGGIFIDILPAFENVRSPGRYYYTVDGHPNARGHALLARILADALTGGAVPELAARENSTQSPPARMAATRSKP